ncbi:type II toxin-antitoxin system Phd/YefM family antitoxin [Krasilnikoviella flava]|uniref:Antitoxin n=1 Tax=Krasilnikoviella flava TaxID=526729 RepID=A0A1T5LIT1_9MICO|nr:type II toxin-antitoxin system prevent-host-death family antitoxin [Krasilnikoviella flava]SKC75882.1 prevent-host-death family protein [Krasilnikoviella flava]
MRTVNVHDAKTHLSRLLAAVEEGEEIVIARAGRPVARLVGTGPTTRPRRELGPLRGGFTVPDDLDHWAQDEVVALFEGDRADGHR